MARDVVTVCAWCPPERRDRVPDGAKVSHTACPECFRQLMAEADEYEEEETMTGGESDED